MHRLRLMCAKEVLQIPSSRNDRKITGMNMCTKQYQNTKQTQKKESQHKGLAW